MRLSEELKKGLHSSMEELRRKGMNPGELRARYLLTIQNCSKEILEDIRKYGEVEECIPMNLMPYGSGKRTVVSVDIRYDKIIDLLEKNYVKEYEEERRVCTLHAAA